jgi:hypothetical protein
MKSQIVALALAIMPAQALAQTLIEEPPPGATLVRASWAHVPGWDEGMIAWPPFAALLGVSGTVEMNCIAQVDGTITDCEATAAPTGWGFEQAALDLADQSRVSPRTVDGVPWASRLAFRTVFRHGDLEAGPAYSGPEPTTVDLALIRAFVNMNASVEDLVCVDVTLLTDEQRAAVMPLLRGSFEEYRAEWTDAMALGLARQLPVGFAETVRNGGPVPDMLTVVDVGAFHEARAVEMRIFARTRALYCAQYGCPSI